MIYSTELINTPISLVFNIKLFWFEIRRGKALCHIWEHAKKPPNKQKTTIKSTLILPIAKKGIRSDLKNKIFKKHIAWTLTELSFKIVSENIWEPVLFTYLTKFYYLVFLIQWDISKLHLWMFQSIVTVILSYAERIKQSYFSVGTDTDRKAIFINKVCQYPKW